MDVYTASTQDYKKTMSASMCSLISEQIDIKRGGVDGAVVTISPARPLIASTIVSQTIAPLFKHLEVASAGVYEPYSTELDSFTKSAAWASKFFYESAHLTTVGELIPYYKAINELLFERKYKECDIFLSYIKVENLSDVLLVGLLRLTYSKRDELTTWNDLLTKSVKALEKRGLKGKVMLKGLI